MEQLTPYLSSILTLTGVQIIALISPGPDFAIVVRNSLIYSRKTALFTALGIALGIMVHVCYIMLGLGLVIAKTGWLFSALKYVGASYLLYIGFKGILAKKHILDFASQAKPEVSLPAALRSGFLTNALNPKAMLFFLSVFSVIAAPDTPMFIMAIYSAIIFSTTLLWFCLVALCFSGQVIRAKVSAYCYIIERVTGGLLILIGFKLLFH